MVKLPKMMLRVLGWLLRALLPELNAMPRFLRKRLPKEAPQTPRSTRPIDGPRGLLLKLDHYRRAHHMKGFNEKFMTKCEARRRGSYRRACAFETRASPIHCVANGRLRQTGEGAVRPAPPCSTHTSPRTTRSWPPCWRRNEPDTAAYRAHAGLERPGPLGERRARGRRLHCFVLANDVDTEAFAFTTRPRTHFKRAAGRKGIPKVPRFAGPSHWPAGYSRWHSVRENTNRLHVVPHHTTLKLCCTNSCSLNARPRHHRCRLIWTRPNAKDTEARILVTTGPRIHPKFAAVRKGISKCTPFPALSHWLASHARDHSFS